MKRFLLLMTVLVLLGYSCSTTDASVASDSREPLPYEEEEFPQWSRDLRRGEVIFLGSLPFLYMLTNLGYDQLMSTLNSETGVVEDYSQGEHLNRKLAISFSLSGVVALTDYILGLVEKNKE